MVKSRCCAVAPHTKRNNATVILDTATTLATGGATIDLLVLARRVLERCNATRFTTNLATNRLQDATINDMQHKPQVHPINRTRITKKSCAVALSMGRNDATDNVCRQCGYNKPFCSCDTSYSGMVTCDTCEYFTPDIIGDGAGIGRCGRGIIWTEVLNRRTPLYRYADRYCEKYSNTRVNVC